MCWSTTSTKRRQSRCAFVELCKLLGRLGFQQRVKGDHHIFARGDVTEIINLQPKGHKIKPYQARQVKGVLVKYRQGGTDAKQI